LVVLVAAALLTGIVAWQRRSLVFGGVALIVLGAAAWPWAAGETPSGRTAAIERAHRTQAAEDDAGDEYTAAVAGIDEWHRVKGPDDPTALRVAVDQQLAALEEQRRSPDPEIARAAEAQIAVAQQRRFELQSAEVQLGELTAKRADAARALTEAQRANATAQDAIPPQPADSTIDVLRRLLALALGGLGLAVLGAALAQHRLRRQQPEPVTWPSIFAPGAPAPPILDRTPAPRDEATVNVAPDGPRARSQPPVLRPTQPVPVSTPHPARKRRRHN
jgi:hypothetical protein